MATIDIGKLTFTHKGDYSGSTAYVLNDVVYYNGSAYIAKTSTTGNLPTSTAHWNQFSAGSGGIWNSGLSIGTAGQVVKVNSGASALEFGTVSSDYVKISESTTSGTPSTIDFKTTAQSGELDFSTYSRYEIYMDYVTHNYSGSDAANLHVRFLDNSGSQLTAANYFCINNAPSLSGTSDNGFRSNDYGRLTRDYIGKQSGRSQHVHLTIHDLTNTSYDKTITAHLYGNNHDGTGGTPRADITTVFYASTAAMSGIRLYFSGGNFVDGIKIRTYGVK